MKRLSIFGGKRLFGVCEISGFKNAALPILYASLLTRDVSLIENVPRIRDVMITLSLLSEMGAVVGFTEGNTLLLDTRSISPRKISKTLCGKLRASTYLLGAGLASFGEITVPLSGGCPIGRRPIDLHIGALRRLGAEVTVGEEGVSVSGKNLIGTEIEFKTPSVGATVNTILAAAAATGETVIKGAAKEPHIAELCRYLIRCGADIGGVGTDRITVTGKKKLTGGSHCLMPDMIEAGTFLCAVGAAGGEIFLKNAREGELSATVELLRAMGLRIEGGKEGISAKREGVLAPFSAIAAPYPRFPTDMHPQLVSLGCLADGESRLTDTVFPDRFAYTEELRRLGGELTVRGNTVTAVGGRLHGGRVEAVDLRAGAALVVAGLAARGQVVIENAEMIERGYVDLPGKLRRLGASLIFG